jgi:hypothetical protein
LLPPLKFSIGPNDIHAYTDGSGMTLKDTNEYVCGAGVSTTAGTNGTSIEQSFSWDKGRQTVPKGELAGIYAALDSIRKNLTGRATLSEKNDY